MDKGDRYVERVQHLPPAPAVIAQLPALFRDPNRDSERLAELIRYDPSLSVELFKRCNSVFFRGAEPAADVFEAVSRLGFNEVQDVVNALISKHTASVARIQDASLADSLWRHSVVTAVAAATLASRVGVTEGPAFTAGLLHDVGKLVFAAYEGPAYKGLMAKAGISGSVLAHAEEAGLGASHADIGARLLSRWGLPANIIHTVQHHHRSLAAAAPFEGLAALIHLANDLAHSLMGGGSGAPEPAARGPDAMTLLQLTGPDVSTALEQTQEQLQRVQEALKVTIVDGQ